MSSWWQCHCYSLLSKDVWWLLAAPVVWDDNNIIIIIIIVEIGPLRPRAQIAALFVAISAAKGGGEVLCYFAPSSPFGFQLSVNLNKTIRQDLVLPAARWLVIVNPWSITTSGSGSVTLHSIGFHGKECHKTRACVDRPHRHDWKCSVPVV